VRLIGTRRGRLSVLHAFAAAVVGLAVVAAASAAGGDLDPSFDGDGKVVIDVGGRDSASDVALQGDGKVVLAGSRVVGFEPPEAAVARLNPNGTLDAGFDADGRTVVSFGGGGAVEPPRVAVQPDGKLVLASASNLAVGRSFALARLNSDGTIDTSFGGSGKVLTDVGDVAGARSLLVQPDGKIVAAGYSRALGPTFETRFSAITHSEFALARYNADGSLDASFGGDGLVETSFGSDQHAQAFCVALAPDGRLVAVGFAFPIASGQIQSRLAIARYQPDGSLDPSFDGDGTLVREFTGGAQARAIALQRDGKIVVGGLANPGPGGNTFAAVRFETSGALDAGFGQQGVASSRTVTATTDVALDPRGRIVIAGGALTGDSSDFGVARFTADGELDRRFGGDGEVTTDVAGDDRTTGIAVQPDGKIVVGGWTGTTQSDFAVTRYMQTTCVVPRVSRNTLPRARAAISRAGCEPGGVRRMFSRTIRKGRVISQRPAARTEVADGTAVALTVSRGRRR
jgi:uncharacterized delta-60 repeat protein